MIEIKEISNYKDYGRILHITNNVIEVAVTLDVGPRIIHFSFVDGQNILHTGRQEFGFMTDEKYTKFYGEGKRWENLGGHRLWLTPESYPETYYPDQDPVSYELTENGAIFTPREETENGIQKMIEIRMDKDDANLQVIMSATNTGKKEKEFSLWGLSVCERNGTLVIPMNTDNTGLLHNRIIAVWPYTDLKDERIYFGTKYTTVKQDANAKTPIKLGFDLKRQCAYYVLGDTVFTKRFATNHGKADYPDGGCSLETYTNDIFIEVESLSELKTVAPGKTVSHTEGWSLTKKPCEVDFKDDNSIDNFLSKL